MLSGRKKRVGEINTTLSKNIFYISSEPFPDGLPDTQ